MQWKRKITKTYYDSLNLTIPWPSDLSKSLFEILFIDYVSCSKNKGHRPKISNSIDFHKLQEPFSLVCKKLLKACSLAIKKPTSSTNNDPLISILQQIDHNILTQTIASVLAMLLHCNPNAVDGSTNHRRPYCRYSTYPNSPGLSQLLSDFIIENIGITRFPSKGIRLNEVETYVDRYLNLKLLDPSMEGGQLLVGLAESWARKVSQQYSNNSRMYNRFIEIGIVKLCKDVLYGIDRNPLAKIAVVTVFKAFCLCNQINPYTPKQLICTDSLRYHSKTEFNAIINNPPWGERTTAEERRYIKQHFKLSSIHIDTYLAFLEGSLNNLISDGVYSFVIPGTLLSGRHSSDIRKYLASETTVKFISLLPRQVFSDAAIRSVVILGRKQKPRRNAVIKVVSSATFSDLDFKKRYSFRSVSHNRLCKTKWQHIVLKKIQFLTVCNTKPLGELSDISTGKRGKEYQIICGNRKHSSAECESLFNKTLPYGYVPAILSRNINPHEINDIQYHSKLTLTQDFKKVSSIGVREFVGIDGRLSAAPILFKSISMKGVLTVIPKSINVFLLTAILNSKTIGNWIVQNTSALINPGYRTISACSLKEIPIPFQAIKYPMSPLRKYNSICHKIINTSKSLRNSNLAKNNNAKYIEELDRLVEILYNSDQHM